MTRLITGFVAVLGALLLGAGLALTIPLSVMASALIIAGTILLTIAATEVG